MDKENTGYQRSLETLETSVSVYVTTNVNFVDAMQGANHGHATCLLPCLAHYLHLHKTQTWFTQTQIPPQHSRYSSLHPTAPRRWRPHRQQAAPRRPASTAG